MLDEVEPGVFRIEVECSTGTYIRTLADDVGRALGGGAHLRNLRRTAIGPFKEDAAHALDTVSPADLLTPVAVVAHLPSVTVDAAGAADVACGRALRASGCAEGPVAVLDEGGALLAVYRNDDDRFVADVVLAAN